MIGGAANDRQVPFFYGEAPVMNLANGFPRVSIKQLKVVVTIHPDKPPSVQIKKADINGERRLEGPDVDALSINLRLDYGVLFFPS
jgi:hypothetical protein